MKKIPQSGQSQGVVPLAWEFVNQLDSRLRGNDVVFANELSGFNNRANKSFDRTSGNYLATFMASLSNHKQSSSIKEPQP